MAVNKKTEFTELDQKLADMSKAMSHPARIAILRVLAERNTCICGEIVEVMPLAQATVSQHLKELMGAGLIKGTIDGKKSCYCINWEAFKEFNSDFNTLFGDLQTASSNQSCC
ncbi:transcriptional regulator [Mucilaginibacter sp. PPCGB 2223]|uniref:ArsR/SmtB family transcription factor n=1 Tax=Mucilaginibacter sp. PPCGB 2223 TaxID=1886027 RepID=UPI0008247589|nr:metalloregulator ArsR/SmtB family transcription factor [Mucilaginibacter sp. PPCGB 2223]OCX53274.1 transcriptional regulator [Mucilaginibacter sp. PPCGB 2223]